MPKNFIEGQQVQLRKDYGSFSTVAIPAGKPFTIAEVSGNSVAIRHPSTGGLVWFTKSEVIAAPPHQEHMIEKANRARSMTLLELWKEHQRTRANTSHSRYSMRFYIELRASWF